MTYPPTSLRRRRPQHISQKGYAYIADISQYLAVSAPTATKTVQRLDDEGLLDYERYRGVFPTQHGETLAEDLRRRHSLVTTFLKQISVDDEAAHRVTEGIEHHIDAPTLERIASFVTHADEDPDWLVRLHHEQDHKR